MSETMLCNHYEILDKYFNNTSSIFRDIYVKVASKIPMSVCEGKMQCKILH